MAISICSCADPSGDASWDLGQPALLHPKAKTAAVYDESAVVEFDVGFDDRNWKAFQDAWKPKKDTSTWFHCSFQFAGVRFLDAACRHKGNPGDADVEKKPQIIVRFDKWVDSGRFFGLRRIDLEALPSFAAPIRDRVAMWALRLGGLTAPRANHAWVTVNGQPLGLYQNIEVVDREFLEQRFDPPIGNLYEKTDGSWSLQTNGDTGDYAAVFALEDTLESWKHRGAGSSTPFLEKVATLVDVPQVLLESAAEMVWPVWDNFSNGGWNFYLYQPAAAKPMVVLPWDFDEVASSTAPFDANPWDFVGHMTGDLQPGLGYDLRNLLFERDDWKQEYADALVVVRDGYYAAARQRTQRVCQQIRPYVEMDPNSYGTLQDFDAGCKDLEDRITARIEFLKSAL
jgi:spore coat protein H